jgi:hypothetical protein
LAVKVFFWELILLVALVLLVIEFERLSRGLSIGLMILLFARGDEARLRRHGSSSDVGGDRDWPVHGAHEDLMPSMEFLAVLREGLVEFDRRLLAVEKRLDELEERHDESQVEAARRLERKRIEAELPVARAK